MELGLFGIPLTLIAVIGLLNAFNMMDGIDGLAGMLALVSVVTIAVYQGSSPWPDLKLPLLLAAALLPYLAVNLGLIGKKIFLSPSTVASYRSHAMRMLGLRDRASLVRLILDRGLLSSA